jgi:hypothetical protein
MTDNVKSDRPMSKTTIDIILIAAMFIFFGIVFIQSMLLSETAGLVPKLTSGVALVLCIIQIVTDVRKRKAEKLSQDVEAVKPAKLRWYYMLLILISYVVSLYLIGFAPSAFLFLCITPYIMKHKKIKANFVLASVATIVLYYAFVKIFYVQLPSGLLIDYLF